jgi:hypothetical protein
MRDKPPSVLKTRRMALAMGHDLRCVRFDAEGGDGGCGEAGCDKGCGVCAEPWAAGWIDEVIEERKLNIQ